MRRWVKDDLDVEAVYMPFASQILEALSHMPWVVVMDGSQAGRGCMVLMVGVLYQKRALPIAWLVYKGKKGHASAERHIQVLEKVMPLLPHTPGCNRVSSGDTLVRTLFARNYIHLLRDMPDYPFSLLIFVLQCFLWLLSAKIAHQTKNFPCSL